MRPQSQPTTSSDLHVCAVTNMLPYIYNHTHNTQVINKILKKSIKLHSHLESVLSHGTRKGMFLHSLPVSDALIVAYDKPDDYA